MLEQFRFIKMSPWTNVVHVGGSEDEYSLRDSLRILALHKRDAFSKAITACMVRNITFDLYPHHISPGGERYGRFGNNVFDRFSHEKIEEPNFSFSDVNHRHGDNV